MTGSDATAAVARPLREDDLERMIAIDRCYTGRARRRFLERRLAGAALHPDAYIHVAIDRDGVLVAFSIARVLQGEYGRAVTSAVVDVLGVAPECRGHGYGRALLDGLLGEARRRSVRHLHSQAEWSDRTLLGFFAATGFELADRLVLERAVGEPFDESGEDV